MSGKVLYGSSQHSYQYPYSEYNNNPNQDPQQQQIDQNGYFGYEGHGAYQQSSQNQLQVDQSTDESLNPLQHLNYQNDWIPSENYDSFNNWSFVGQNQQQTYNDGGTSQGFTNQIINNSNIQNQSTEPYFASFDEVPIDLIESVYKDVNLPSHSQSWNQNPTNITDTGHRPSTNNQFNNLVPPVEDHHLQHGSKSYPHHQTISYHLTQQEPTPTGPYQELNNNNNLVSPNNNYLVSTGYVLSQLESSTLPDVTTTQSQLQNVSPITESSSMAIDNSSMVLEVNCFKCKLCDFISLVKSNVLNHIDTSHKSSGQMLTNSGTGQIVIGSSIPPSTMRGNKSLQESSSQGPQFLASSDINSLLNESATVSATTMTSSPVLSKQPVKIAPKVMPPILVRIDQTKASSSSSSNPSNQASIIPIIIDTSDASEVMSKSNSKSRTNHSKGALLEQGINVISVKSSPLKSKGGRKSLKSSSSTVKKKKIKVEEKDALFHCQVNKCTAKFMTEINLDRHAECHIPGNDIKFKCTICDFTSQHWSSTLGHLWREHAIDLEMHKCEHCNYRTHSLSLLENQHKKIHSNEKNYICDFCTKGFKNNKQLVNHKMIHMKPVSVPAKPVEENPQCDHCCKTFKNRRAFLLHRNSIHKRNKRSYVCSSCGHQASDRNALKTHVRSHTGEKPFKCDKCDYSTSDHNSLRRHKMRHSGERPYKCPFCDYACIQSSTYKQHLRTKHPGEGDAYMFTCTCGFKTVNSENYSSHVREHGASCGVAQHGRSDGESSSYSSSSSPATPALNGPESPDMHLARGILGVSSVKDLHSLKRPRSSMTSPSTSTSSEDDSSLGGIECTPTSAVSIPPTTTSLVNSNNNTNTTNTQSANDNCSDFMEYSLSESNNF